MRQYISKNTGLDADKICTEYKERFYQYMNESDMGSFRERFLSYLNIYSGLAAYEILRECGLSEKQAVSAYDEMCSSMRNLSSLLYKGVDLLPNGFDIVVKNLKSDLKGPSAVC